MNVAGISGINSVRSNQYCGNNSHNQSFGRLAFTCPTARDNFKQMLMRCHSDYVETVIIPLIQANSKNPKTVLTDAKSLVQVLSKRGKLLFHNDQLQSPLIKIVEKLNSLKVEAQRTTWSQKLLEMIPFVGKKAKNTEAAIPQTLDEVLNACPIRNAVKLKQDKVYTKEKLAA